MHCGTIGSCQLAATSEITKRSALQTTVSGAIASVLTFIFNHNIKFKDSSRAFKVLMCNFK